MASLTPHNPPIATGWSHQQPRHFGSISVVMMALSLTFFTCVIPGCERGTPQSELDAASGLSVAPPLASEPDSTLPMVTLEQAFSHLTFIRPVDLVPIPDGSDRLVVIEQAGRVVAFENRDDVTDMTVMLDLREKVFMTYDWGEEGLLSIAFHPDYAENGRAFVYYSAGSPRRSVLSEFTVKPDAPDRLDPESERVILEIEQPAWNHNGGTILFGPEDGYLYLAIGDGGGANDQFGHGQDLGTLLATIIRIDVDQAEGTQPYAVPPDNPFVDHPGARPEIWAFGLRNVWRMSFDPDTGRLWAPDVGQNAWEEINIIERGGNYGWSIREGAHQFDPSRQSAIPGRPLIDPIAEYSHRLGNSITGGHVYRGESIPALRGAYVYGDYGSGRIWAVRYGDGGVTDHREIVEEGERMHLTSFGIDQHGELYACTFDQLTGGATGGIYRLRAR